MTERPLASPATPATPGSAGTPVSPAVPARPDRALLAYRVVANVVGIGLPILLAGAIYGLATAHGLGIKAAAGRPTAVKIVGPIHGFLYILLIILALNLSFRERWNPVFTVLVLLAGTIPFMSFVAERAVTRKIAPGTAPLWVALRPGATERAKASPPPPPPPLS